MNDGFYIILNMRVPTGFEPFGQFYLGDDREFAKGVFKSLTCQKKVAAHDVLQFDLIERRKNLPVDVSIMNCTLEEITNNCRIICKALFRKNNLGTDDM